MSKIFSKTFFAFLTFALIFSPVIFPTKVHASNDYTTSETWGFVAGNCTAYAAWRINRDAGTTVAPYFFKNDFDGNWVNDFKNANNWDDAATRFGIPVDNFPRVGDIAVWESNHVAYVESVNSNGTVNVSEYNWGGDLAYHERTDLTADHYIHFRRAPKSNLIGALQSNGDLYVKNGVDGVNIQISGGVKDFQIDGKSVGILYTDGTFKAIYEFGRTSAEEISTDIKAIEMKNGKIGFLYNDGTFKMKQTFYSSAVEISGNIQKFKFYGTHIGLLYTDNIFKVKEGINGATTQISGGIKDFKFEGTGMAIQYTDGYFKYTANYGVTGVVDIATDVDKFELYGSRIGYLSQSGVLKIKENINAAPVTISAGLSDFKFDGNRMGILYTSGELKYTDNYGVTSPVTISNYVSKFDLLNGRIAYLDTNGYMAYKNSLNTQDTVIDGYGASLKMSENMIGYLQTDGTFKIRDKYDYPWVKISGGIAAFQTEGNTLGFLGTDGVLKYTPNYGVTSPVEISTNISKFKLYGTRIGLLYTNNVFKVKEGVSGPTTEISGGIKDFKFYENKMGILYTDGVFKYTPAYGSIGVTQLTGTVADFELVGNSLGLLYTNGNFDYIENWGGSTTPIATGISKIALTGSRMGYLSSGGTLNIKEHVDATPVTISSALIDFNFEENGNGMGILYNDGVFKYTPNYGVDNVVELGTYISKFRLNGGQVSMLRNYDGYFTIVNKNNQSLIHDPIYFVVKI